MEQMELRRILEGLLFAFSESLSFKRLKEILPEASETDIRQAIDALNADYAAHQHAVKIQDVAGSLQLVTDQSLAPWIRKALQPPKPDAVTAATMETLAIVAYRQPLTKADIEAIRGVDSTASLDTLMEKQFIRVVGRKETPGRPFVYGTTPEFLRHFGLRSLDALPNMPMPTIQEPEDATPQTASSTHSEPSTESTVSTPSN